MLRMADRIEGEEGDFAFLPEARSGAKLAAVPMGQAPISVARYGDHRSVNLPAILCVVAIHAVLITALVQVRQHYVRHEEAKLAVINLMPPPPPPPAAEVPPPPSQPEVVAPPPLVQTPRPPVQLVATTPEPVPHPSPVASTAPPAPPAAAAPVFSGPSTVQAGDLSAQMTSGKAPRYPIESRRKREQGTVTLLLTLGVDGRVSTISISKSSGFSRLDDAARDAVRNWRWAPTIRDGQPVLVRGVVEIPFVLKPAD
jgi:protein TonB